MIALTVGPFGRGVESRPDYIDSRLLAAAVAESHTVPTGAKWVCFSAEMPFYAKFGAAPTAAIPAADVTDGTGSMFNPTWVDISSGAAVISVIARTAGVVSMYFYA